MVVVVVPAENYLQTPQGNVTTVYVRTSSAAENGNRVNVNLNDVGISATGLLAVEGYRHSTSGSVIVAEAPTTAVSAGVLSITIGGSGAGVRVYKVTGVARSVDFATPT